jgi:hypothetical protein
MRIKLLILDIPMGLSFDGLGHIARELRCDPDDLSPQEVVMFLNKQRDKLKILGRNGSKANDIVEVIGYIRAPRGQPLSLDAIQFLPQTFHEKGRFDYSAALKLSLQKAFETATKRRGERRVISPLEAYRASKTG